MIPRILSVAFSAILGAQTVPAGADGWDKLLAGTGAAGLVAGLFVFATRHNTASHEKAAAIFADAVKSCSADSAKSSEHFAETVERQSERFAETTTTLLREMRDDSAKREQSLIDMQRDKQRAG